MEGKPTKFPSKKQPPGYRIWGENRCISALYLMQGTWPAAYLGCRWPAGYFPWPAGQGSKGSMRISGRPYQKGSLSGVHNTIMWSKAGDSGPGGRTTHFSKGFKRVNNNYWPATKYWWPPRCVHHKYGVYGARKWPKGGQHWL